MKGLDLNHVSKGVPRKALKLSFVEYDITLENTIIFLVNGIKRTEQRINGVTCYKTWPAACQQLLLVSAGLSSGYNFIGRDALGDHRGTEHRRTRAYDVTIQRYRKSFTKVNVNKMYIWRHVSSNFCVKCQWRPLKILRIFWIHTHQDMHFTKW